MYIEEATLVGPGRLITNVTSKLSSHSIKCEQQENECEKQKEEQLNFFHEFEFKVLKRRFLTLNAGLIPNSKCMLVLTIYDRTIYCSMLVVITPR